MSFKGFVYGLFCTCDECRSKAPGEIRYVGVTEVSIGHRLRSHLQEAGKGTSRRAKDLWIRKHGPENIRAFYLDDQESVENLKASEINWIRKLDTFGTPRGLNLTRGGEGVWGLKMSEESRAKLRARTAKQMRENPPRAKLSQEDVREVLRLLWRGESAKDISLKYSVTPFTVQKISDWKNWKDVPRPVGPRENPGGHMWKTWQTRRMVE